MMLAEFFAAATQQAPVEESLPLLKWLTGAGGLGVLAWVVWNLSTGKLVWDRDVAYREKLLGDMTEDRDEWKRMAMEAIQNNHRLARASEKAVGTAEQAVSAATQIASAK